MVIILGVPIFRIFTVLPCKRKRSSQMHVYGHELSCLWTWSLLFCDYGPTEQNPGSNHVVPELF